MIADSDGPRSVTEPSPNGCETRACRDGALRAALEAARLAGAAVRAIRGRPGLGAELPLEEARRVVETVVREHLRAIRGDEARDESLLTTGPRWRIAPLEGTRSLIAGLPHVATLIAYEGEDGRTELAVIHAPLMGSEPDALRGGDPDTPSSAAPHANDDASLRGAHGDAGHGTKPDRRDARSRRSASARAGATPNPTAALVERLDPYAGRTWYALRGAGAFVIEGTRLDGPARLLAPRDGGSTPRSAGERPKRRANSWWDHVLLAEGRTESSLPPAAGHRGAAALALRLFVEEALDLRHEGDGDRDGE